MAYGLIGGVCALTVMVFAGKLALPEPAYDSLPFVASALPETVGEFASDVPWFCHDPQCLNVTEERELIKKIQGSSAEYVCPSCGGAMHRASLGETSDLPKDTTILKRNYRSPDGLRYAVSVVIGGRNRSSIHRAELCLPAQGFVMSDAERLVLKLAPDRPLALRKITLQRSGGEKTNLVYWFISKERESCSHAERIGLDVWDRSIHNRINRWVMVAVNLSSQLDSPESLERFTAFLSEFYPQIIRDRGAGL